MHNLEEHCSCGLCRSPQLWTLRTNQEAEPQIFTLAYEAAVPNRQRVACQHASIRSTNWSKGTCGWRSRPPGFRRFCIQYRDATQLNNTSCIDACTAERPQTAPSLQTPYHACAGPKKPRRCPKFHHPTSAGPQRNTLDMNSAVT